MRYFYILIFVICSTVLQVNVLAASSNLDREVELYADEFIYSSVSFQTDDCGTVTIDGWSSWSNGSCTGYCYDISSDCGSGNVSGANAPSGMLNGDGTISRRYMQAQMNTQLQN